MVGMQEGVECDSSEREVFTDTLGTVTPVDRCSSAQATLAATLVIVTFWPLFQIAQFLAGVFGVFGVNPPPPASC